MVWLARSAGGPTCARGSSASLKGDKLSRQRLNSYSSFSSFCHVDAGMILTCILRAVRAGCWVASAFVPRDSTLLKREASSMERYCTNGPYPSCSNWFADRPTGKLLH